jgi:ComF family protein
MALSTVKDILDQIKYDILDFIYPPTCPICQRSLKREESLVCEECWNNLTILPSPFCPYCKSFFEGENFAAEHQCVCLSRVEHRKILAVRSLGTFDDFYQKLIHRFKYDKKVPIGRKLANSMGKEVAKTEGFGDIDLIVPVPLHPARQRERGFNQSEILAEGISKATGIPLAEGVLKRKKNTKDQTYLNAQQRAENVRGAFLVKEPYRIEGKRVILVDDVMTTGATLNECATTLRNCGAEDIFAATLAVVVN